MIRFSHITFFVGNFLRLTIRPRNLKDFFLNWDLDVHRLGITVCWHQRQKIVVVYKGFGKSSDGVWKYITPHRFWAFGWFRWAFPDKGRGELSGGPEFRTMECWPPKLSIDGILFGMWLQFHRAHRRHRRRQTQPAS